MAKSDFNLDNILTREEYTAETGISARENSYSLNANQALVLPLELFGRYHDINSDFLIEFRYVSENKSRTTYSRFYEYEDLKRHEKEILDPGNRGHHIYLGVNPRPPSKQKTQDHIKDIVAVWVDVDGKNFLAGKNASWKIIADFPLTPTIIIDSGNGYHLYWILENPILNRTEDESLQLKQIMNGLTTALNADMAVKDFSRVMRLPGTLNIKDPNNPLPCLIKQLSLGNVYSLDDFEAYRDFHYSEVSSIDQNSIQFGGKDLIVSNQDAYQAHKEVQALKISQQIKRMIITGECKKGGRTYASRSERDMAIIVDLVAADYSYSTIRSIFFNEYLGCSDRMLEDPKRSYKKLKRDVRKAITLISKSKRYLSPGEEAISRIKASGLKGDAKVKAISSYIGKDLFGEL